MDQKWIWEDKLGVDIFFVLSGLLMARILFEQKMPLKKFYIRRISRILPVFFAYVAVIYALAYLARFEFSYQELLATLFFLRTYVPSEVHLFTTDIAVGHLWSLNVEEHAYVLLSLMTLLIISLRNAGLTLILLGVASIVFNLLTFHGAIGQEKDPYFYIRTEHAICFILLSAGYRLISVQNSWRLDSRLPPIFFLLSVACYLDISPEWAPFTLAPMFLAITVNHLTDCSISIKKVLSSSLLCQLGLYSYSIYLWQQPFYRYHQIIPGGLFAGLLLALIAGYCSYHYFEQPVRSWINKRWG